jgi:hypothetical protein
MIEFVELRYENDLLERHYGESLELMNDLSVPAAKQPVLTTLLGKGTTSNLAAYYIRMPFKLNLPLCALKKAPVFRVKFLPSQEFSTLNWTLPIKVNLFVDYVYVTKAERDYFKTAKIDYLTHTIQRLQFTVGAGVTDEVVVSEFTRPVKELYWVIHTDGSAAYDYLNEGSEQLVSLRLQFNGVDIILPEFGTPLFLRTIQGLESHTRVPDRFFYMYPFALDPEHPDQPTGSVNMSAMTRQIHTFKLTPCDYSRQIRIYALTHNVVRIADGAATSLFDNVQEGGTETTSTQKTYNPIYPGLYYFDTFTFTTLGTSGRIGPDSTSEYMNPPWNPGQFSIVDGQQYWTVPTSGFYRILAAGAYGATPGRVVSGDVILYEGQILQILVGQQPTPLTAITEDNITVGGGGGTFITTDGTPLIVASGGDGGSYSIDLTASPGSFLPPGDGNGIVGAGYYTDGSQSNPFFNFLTPKALVNGGFGMNYQYGQIGVPEEGGFGGGQSPFGLLTSLVSIVGDGVTPYYTVTTSLPHGYPANYAVNISGTVSFDGVYSITVTGTDTFVFEAAGVFPNEATGFVSGTSYGVSGGGGYTGSPGDGSSGATCYADSSVMNFTDLGQTDDAAGYVTITFYTILPQKPLLPPPAAVTGLTASNPTTSSVHLAWTGAIRAMSYSIVSTPATTTRTTSGTSLTFTGLTTGTEYTFTITPSNATGNGPPTTSDPISTLPPLPGAVTNFVASNPTDTTVDLTWNSASYASSYSIHSSPATTTRTTSDTSLTFTGLTTETEYTFTITPSNVVGNGPPTTSDPISTLIPYPGFAPNIYDTPVSVTTTTIELAWPDYTPLYAASYKVYCHDPNTYDVLYVQTCPLTPPYYTFTGLQTNYAYSFQLSSVNARGEQETPTAPSFPMYTIPTVTGVSVSNPTETTVDVTWDVPGGNLGLGQFYWIITTTPETTTQYASGTNVYTFTGLTPDTSYTFTVTPQVAYNYLTGDPVTSDPISTLLPLPGDAPAMYNPTNVTATTMDLSWLEFVPQYATSFNVYAYSVIDGLIGFVNVPISSFSYTYTGLTPDTEYYFTVAGVNATGVGPQNGAPTLNTYTLIRVNLTYTGGYGTLFLRSGTYTFQMAGGSGPVRYPSGRCFAEYTFQYTLTSDTNIEYRIGQASPDDTGGAGGTYIYDTDNSQWLFITGGAGTNNFSPNPSENDPGDGSGGVAGSGGGSGAGVNSNGSDSTVSAGYGGLTYANGGYGGAAGDFGYARPGGFGGGGGGTLIYDESLGLVYYPGGGGGYTGGTNYTNYDPGNYREWVSTPGTSYMIPGATCIASSTNQGAAPVTNGYININP